MILLIVHFFQLLLQVLGVNLVYTSNFYNLTTLNNILYKVNNT